MTEPLAGKELQDALSVFFVKLMKFVSSEETPQVAVLGLAQILGFTIGLGYDNPEDVLADVLSIIIKETATIKPTRAAMKGKTLEEKIEIFKRGDG
jgi:hypothetical protein